MFFENKAQQLLSLPKYYKRQISYAIYSFTLLFLSLLMGVLGYKYLGHLNWVDSLLNASMILGGMGPVDYLKNNAAKIFASFYAIYSGMIAIASFGLLVAPLIHRIFHHFHIIDESERI